MRIVIDMQGAQSTGSRGRGIGRYTQSLTKALVRNSGGHEVIVALNGAFPESVAAVRESLASLLPHDAIRTWMTPGPVRQIDASTAWRRRCAELVREAFLASLQPSVVLVCSLFEGLDDDAVTSVGTLGEGTVPTAVILYDLIPLIHRDHYLQNPLVASWYEGKIVHLRRAGLLLSISESSRSEAVRHLGMPPESVVNISTAADQHFVETEVEPAQAEDLRGRYGIRGPFAMYTGGIDHRKNIARLIEAYALLDRQVRASHQLVIVCSVSDVDRARLADVAGRAGLMAGEMVLTGYVAEADLVALYALCRVFVFPSWHEGFGLPALEAMACGSAVIGADSSSIPEVIGLADALFDPFDSAAISALLGRALTDEVFNRRLRLHGLEQATRFSWDESARRVMGALEALVASVSAGPRHVRQPARRLRLAYVSPLSPERSGISDYSAELLPELFRFYDIDIVSAQRRIDDPWILGNCPVRSVDWFRSNAHRYDRVLYHVGNSSFHQHMFALLEEVPGVVVLHDFFLSGIMAHLELSGAGPGAWTQALYDSHGYPAVQDRTRCRQAEEVIWKYPCNRSVLQAAQGVIVHSREATRLAQRWYGADACKERWAQIPLLRTPLAVTENARREAREALGLGPDDFVVCSFGMVAPSKMHRRLLAAWLASPLAADPHCMLVFVGENPASLYGAELANAIAKSACAARIRVTGWTEPPDFRRYLMAGDVGVQLRCNSRGETSAAALDCMNAGLATIVNANGSMGELPSSAVHMLPDAFSDAELANALACMYADPPLRARLGMEAFRFVRAGHAPHACAEAYFDAMETFARASATGTAGVVQAVARLDDAPQNPACWIALADAIDRSLEPPLSCPQLLIDISALQDAAGATVPPAALEAVARCVLDAAPLGYRIEPVYLANSQPAYRYARRWTLDALKLSAASLADEPVNVGAGDVLVIAGGWASSAERAVEIRVRLANGGARILPVPVVPAGISGGRAEPAPLSLEQWLQSRLSAACAWPSLTAHAAQHIEQSTT